MKTQRDQKKKKKNAINLAISSPNPSVFAVI